MNFKGKIKEVITYLLDLDPNKEYNVDIKEAKSKRTIQQNRYMWKLINEIAKIQYMDDMEIYIQALEESNAKYEYLLGLSTIEEELKKNFRAVKVERPEEYNGKPMLVYKCFIR